MKLSCAMIVRDDASTLRACLESIRPHVDELVVIDTGSVDDSPNIAREFADHFEVWLGCNDEEGRIDDFALARNYSFSRASGDWIVWFDADDVVHGGEHMRELCEQATADNHTYLFRYEYARDPNGNVTCLQLRERLMRPRHKMFWRSPVHEFCGLDAEPEGTVATIASDLVVVEHKSYLASKQREPQRNLRILKKHVARVGEADVRALYYIGVEYATIGEVGQSLRYLRRYVDLADWDDEKCKALLMIGEHYRGIGDHATAIEWTQKAMITKSWPEPWFAMGRSFYAMAQRGERPDYNYRRACYHIMKGLDHPTDVVLFANPQERFDIHSFLNVCFHATGDTDRAIWSCDEGLKVYPQRADLIHNKRIYMAERRKATVLMNVVELEKDGEIAPIQRQAIQAILKGDLNLTKELPGPAVHATRTLEEPVPAPGKLSLAFFLGHQVEPWNPDTFAAGGMGGSETMAWELARRLAKKGHAVTIYGHCTPTLEGTFEGVLFLDASKFRDVECDVLIASRQPAAVDDAFGCKATARVLWVHDVHCGEGLTMARGVRFDRILCLSQWHKEFFCQVYKTGDHSKVHVTRNGIDLSRFEGTEKRNPHRAVYSSSPDRGLLAALMAWPKVRKEIPDAELHVFYGWKNWEVAAEQAGDREQQASISHLKHLCRTTAGVVVRGRVNQKELAREFMRAGVWLYPTWFSETSCITAMEAQAAGCYIVTSPVAALNETVGGRGHMLSEQWHPPSLPAPAPPQAFIDEVAKATVLYMKPEDTDDEHRAERQRHARETFGLDSLADDWDAWLLELEAERKLEPVPRFRGAAE